MVGIAEGQFRGPTLGEAAKQVEAGCHDGGARGEGGYGSGRKKGGEGGYGSGRKNVAEPPELSGPHAYIIVPKTSDRRARVPNDSRSLSGVLGKPESST